MLFGLDVLAGARYPKVVLEHAPHGWALGFFWDTFGPVKGLLNKIGAAGCWPLVRVQGIWSDTHTFGPTDVTKAINIAEELQVLANKFPNITWQFSPFCEHRKDVAFMKDAFQKIKAVAPGLELVNTPIAGGDFVPGVINEWHHSNPAPTSGKCQFSYDGLSTFDSDVEKAKSKATTKKAGVFFMWWWQLNMKMNAHDTTPRPLRKAKPRKEQFQTAVELATDKKIDSVSKQWQWKSVSEQHQAPTPAPDDCKPVIIGPQKGKITVKSGTKTIAFDAPVPDAHNPGDWVYRTRSVYACNLKRPVTIMFNGKSIGKIDPCFRSSKRYIEE